MLRNRALLSGVPKTGVQFDFWATGKVNSLPLPQPLLLMQKVRKSELRYNWQCVRRLTG